MKKHKGSSGLDDFGLIVLVVLAVLLVWNIIQEVISPREERYYMITQRELKELISTDKPIHIAD